MDLSVSVYIWLSFFREHINVYTLENRKKRNRLCVSFLFNEDSSDIGKNQVSAQCNKNFR